MIMVDPWDLMNAFFEGVGAFLTWLNVRRLWIDREVKGIQWQVTLFWCAWGVFNLFFYGPHLGLWLSWAMGAVLVAANFAWIMLLLYCKGVHEQLLRYIRL